MPYKTIAKEISILIGISITMAFTVNLISPRGISVVGQWDTSQGVISPKTKGDTVDQSLDIKDPAEAKRLYDSGTAVFVDARSIETYNEGHIKGAVSLPVNDFDQLIGQFLNKHPQSSPLVTYCSARECDDSHELAQYLLNEGYRTVRVFIDGYPAWKKEGFPIE